MARGERAGARGPRGVSGPSARPHPARPPRPRGAEKNDPTFPAGPPDVDSGAHAAAADQRPPGGITCEGNSKAAP